MQKKFNFAEEITLYSHFKNIKIFGLHANFFVTKLTQSLIFFQNKGVGQAGLLYYSDYK